MKSVSQTVHTPGINNSRKLIQISAIILCAILLTTIQDFLHSYFNQYSFYLSESLLFKSFWVLFLPLTIAQLWAIKNYRQQLSKRSKIISILSLTFLPTLIHVLLFPLALLILSALFFNHTYSFLSSLEYTLREDLYKYLFIYGLVAYFSLTKNKRAVGESVMKAVEDPGRESFKTHITIREGRKNIAVKVSDINFISSANPYISIHTSEDKHLHLATLKTIAEALDPYQFVRVHKSAIVNIKKVSSYRSRLNGDYDIILLNGESVRLSRNYTQSFKKHFL